MKAVTNNIDHAAEMQDISINPDLPRAEREAEYLRQTGDPRHLRFGDTRVDAAFTPDGPSLEDCLVRLLML